MGRFGYWLSACAAAACRKTSTAAASKRIEHARARRPPAPLPRYRRTAARAGEFMPIKLAENFRAVFYAPFYATHALGFHAREGVEVELVSSPAPAAAQSSLFDGTIDISWGGPMRVMKARDDDPGSPLVCFCEVAGRDPFFLVGRNDRAPFRLTDLPRLRLASVSEVPTPWLCLQHDLREQGIEPGKLHRVADRSMADNLASLRRGELDVVQMFEPYVSMALLAGAGEILYAASA